MPEENGENYEYLYQMKKMAKEAGLEYYAKVAWKKGDFVANTGRKSKNTEEIAFFTKGKARNLRHFFHLIEVFIIFPIFFRHELYQKTPFFQHPVFFIKVFLRILKTFIGRKMGKIMNTSIR